MKIPPFGYSTAEVKATLDELRVPMSMAVIRAKNPFNVGAIIRVAHSFLVKELYLIGVEPFYEKASMGMHKYENIVECPTEEAFLAQTAGRPLIALERDHATQTIWEAAMPDDAVFVMGSENDGVPEPILRACASVVAIPMYGINHSFPVTVAAGIVLTEWARRRDPRARMAPES